jgi:hypothetical protein
VTSEVALGEAAPLYLYSEDAAQRIKQYVPDAKIIVVLRHPVERAYSHFLFHVREGVEPLADFARVIEDQARRKQANWSWGWYIIDLGFYYEQLKRYYETFPPEQIRVYLYEEVRANQQEVLRDICRFVGVDDTFEPDLDHRPNRSGIPQNQWLHRLLMRPNAARAVSRVLLPEPVRFWIADRLKARLFTRLARPTLSPIVRQQLVELYREDILKLQDLIGRDLSAWLR